MRNRWTTGLLSGLLTVAVLPVSPVSAVSGEVIGYGQGTAVDSENRPVDAVAFDAQYAQYDAYVDWKTDAQPDPAESLERLRAHAHGGEILLLHAVSSTNAEILGDLIDALRAEGYTL